MYNIHISLQYEYFDIKQWHNLLYKYFNNIIPRTRTAKYSSGLNEHFCHSIKVQNDTVLLKWIILCKLYTIEVFMILWAPSVWHLYPSSHCSNPFELQKVKANHEDSAYHLFLSRDRVPQNGDIAAAPRIEFGHRRYSDWTDQ